MEKLDKNYIFLQLALKKVRASCLTSVTREKVGTCPICPICPQSCRKGQVENCPEGKCTKLNNILNIYIYILLYQTRNNIYRYQKCSNKILTSYYLRMQENLFEFFNLSTTHGPQGIENDIKTLNKILNNKIEPII